MDTIKLQQLIDKLKRRNNKAYVFFENIVQDLKEESTKQEGLNKLSRCFSIIQYANFNFEEEHLLSEILNEIN
jgi:hypothetical protein